MNKFKWLPVFLIVLISCYKNNKEKSDFTIAFGSCNNQILENKLWHEIEKHHPDIFIWGGDIIYSDTEDMTYLEKNYNIQKNDSAYSKFSENVEILGTWDDHDYGLNDGGAEYSKKADAQKLLLDFFDVPKNDKRRNQEGVYYSKEYQINNNSVKIIILDTRYFRSPLTDDNETRKRYKPSHSKEDTMLGERQWKWLEEELSNSKASFNIVMSSIQFLSAEHGYESWGNMLNEVERFENILNKTAAKNVIILSGDRHISEISQKQIPGLKYPLIDFTSSGMTHSYSNFESEPNKYRVVDVVSDKSFGLLTIDFKSKSVKMEIIGEKNTLYRTYTQKYEL